jgi:glycolate oxidase FAD binding subunit
MTSSHTVASGMRPLDAEMPRTSAEVAEIIRQAAASGQGLRLMGRGSWLEAGHPVRAARSVSLLMTRGIVAYNPADLTITSGAGTTIAELDEVTRAHQQWCPLAPPGPDIFNTVGATIATASAGPYAATFGRPRNLVLGLECVDGTGRIIAAGGRVVKNVAGFDLTRTMIGAWGTLGAITLVHLRLRALPTVSEWWSLRARKSDAARLDAFVRGPLAPLACVRFIPPEVPPDADEELFFVHLGGNPAFVEASRSALRALGDARERDPRALQTLDAFGVQPSFTLEWRLDALALRLRDRFDPHRILNPGLLGEPA